MKKTALFSILILILITSLVKNSTKEIEDKIFTKKENTRLLRAELGDVMLEYNYLSSPEKLIQYQNIIHRFFPLDTEFLSEKFLKKWNPHLVCFVDSEIWPNFLFKIKEKKIPLLLINARLTKKSFRKWKILSNFAKKVFNNFDLCLAASKESKNNLDNFKVKNSTNFDK